MTHPPRRQSSLAAIHSYVSPGLLMMCVLLLSFGFAPQAKAEDAKRPNVLLLLVDDLKPNLGIYGDKIARSPNIDRLAKRGVRFNLAYCNQAVCAPSRINLLSGLRSTSTGLYGLSRDLRDAVPDALTLPQYFRKYGYYAEAMGKVFHFGHGSHGDPQSWSVAPWRESPIDYAMINSTGGHLSREEAMFANYEGNIGDLPRGAAWECADVEDDVYADGRIAREAIRRLRINAKRDQPFFMAVGFTKPHLPFCAPKKYWDMYDPAQFELATYLKQPEGAPDFAGKQHRGELANYDPVPGGAKPLEDDLARTLIHGYYAAMTYMDSQLGLVLDELDRLKLTDNTIVVLWGDHGFHLGDHSIWTKHTNYEQANRIPIVICAPGVTPPNTATDSMAETVDIYPTLAELAGLPKEGLPSTLDGKSLAPVLRDPSKIISEHVYHAYPRGDRMGRCIRTPRYRMVEWKAPGASPDTAIYELYDYETDPGELKNHADEQPEVLAKLKAILAQYPEAVR